MIVTLALRSLLSHPVRSAVLAGGFGLGVAVMAALLGVGGVILEQARAPQLAGGGDVVVGGASGKLTSARFVLSGVLGAGPLAPQGRGGGADRSAPTLYLIDSRGTTPVRVRGGIPSLERALGDPETRGVAAWTDTPADRALGRAGRRSGAARDGSLPPDPRRAGARRVLGGVAVLQRPRGRRALLPDVPGRPARRVRPARRRRPAAARSRRPHDVLRRRRRRSTSASCSPPRRT